MYTTCISLLKFTLHAKLINVEKVEKKYFIRL